MKTSRPRIPSSVTACAIAVVLGGSTPALAHEVNICVKVGTQYSDSDSAQDHWTSTSTTFRKYRGGRAVVKRSGSTIFDGYLGSSFDSRYKGCTGFLSAPSGLSTYDVTIRASGKIDGNTVNVYYEGESTVRQHSFSVIIPGAPNGSQVRTYVNTDPIVNVFDVSSAILFAYNNDFGEVSGYDLKVYIQDWVGNECSAGNGFQHISGNTIPQSCFRTISTGVGEIHLSPIHPNLKFLITHELGHALAHAGGAADCMLGANYSISSSYCPSVTGHAPGSKEYQKSAATEGFAHFFAADSWNSHNEDDCQFVYYGAPLQLINCEIGDAAYPSKFLKTQCPTPHSERGVEVDWLRTFWDVHTDGSGHTDLADMLEWLADGSCSLEDAYEEIDDMANNFPAIDCCWDDAKCRNGVNDPDQGTCVPCSGSC